jgi:pimeloyl-ACP methyl ester carboxylesterase
MIFLQRKWLRTQLWLLTFFLVCVLLIVAEPSFPMLIVGAICTIVCLFNAYLEFMVTAIFIRPLQPKNSAQGSQWISHFGVHKGLQTHIQVHSSAPENPLIIFIHGWRSTSASIEDRALWFVEKKWNVVLLELPGHGQSSPLHRWNAITSAEHIGFHLRNIRTYISISEPAPVFLYGHSMGGYMCSRLSSQQTEPLGFNISGVIMESPLTLYSHILDEICKHLRIPKILRSMHLKRLYRDVQMMHPEIVATDSLQQFDVPEWGLPDAPMLCLQSMNDNRLGRAHYDALVLHAGEDYALTHHLIESLTHSGARKNTEREHLLLAWLESFDSLLL